MQEYIEVKATVRKPKNAIKVGIDLDECIADQQFFRIMCHLLHPEYEIHVVSNLGEENRGKMMEELARYRIQFSKLVFTGNKEEYLLKQCIEIEIN
jgi:hypothetical protein